jgi:hypothetical protein
MKHKFNLFKVRELQNSSVVYQRVAQKNLFFKIFPHFFFRLVRLFQIYDVAVDFYWPS